MSERNYYVICDDNCKFESMTKEQIVSAIAASTGHTPSDQEIDSAFITKIKEMNANNQLQWWVGTEAQYNAISEKDIHTLYIITDSNDYEDLVAAFEALQNHVDELLTVINVSSSSTSVEANDWEGISINLNKSGYTPIAIAGISLDYNMDSISKLNITKFTISKIIDRHILSVTVENLSSSAKNVTLNAEILYMKN